MRRAASFALLLVGACASDPILVLPSVEGAAAWLVLASGEGLPSATHLSPQGTLELDPSPFERLEAVAFAAPLPVPFGPLERLSEGEPLPDALGVFSTSPRELAWQADLPSPALAATRLPPAADDCSRFDLEIVETGVADVAGVRALATLESGVRGVYTSSVWLHVTSELVRPLQVHFPGLITATTDPARTLWAVTPGRMWTVFGDDPFQTTATPMWPIPAELSLAIALASPRPGEVFALTAEGVLLRTTSSTTTVVHRFARTGIEARGAVVADGTGVLAAFGGDSGFVRVEGERVTRVEIPAPEGISAIARFGALGIVVGTIPGALRAERDGYAELPDPLGQMPRGRTVTVLEPDGDRLVFGGRRFFGELTPRGFICQAEAPPAIVVRQISRLDDQYLVTGEGASNAAVRLHRYRLRKP